jgi:hypothetical protein
MPAQTHAAVNPAILLLEPVKLHDGEAIERDHDASQLLPKVTNKHQGRFSTVDMTDRHSIKHDFRACL